MKKILLSISMLVSFLNASWLPSVFNTPQKQEKMLSATDFSQIENKIGKVPMMLEFGATSCHSCIVMGKMLYKVKQKYPDAHIYFIDIYKDRQTAMKFGIRMIPTQKYLDKDGNLIETHMGVIDEVAFEEKLKTLGIL